MKYAIDCLSQHPTFPLMFRAVKFSAKLMGQAMAKRQKVTILYATETGKSEHYANLLKELFSYAFNPRVSATRRTVICTKYDCVER